MDNDKISVKPDTIFLEDFLADVAKGSYRVPSFQRDFVWNRGKIIDLFDSILKGYPIGSLLFWKTELKYRTKPEIASYLIQNDGQNFSYILDGFQRLTALFGALINPGNSKDYKIFFDLESNNFSYVKSKNNLLSIPLNEIYDIKKLFDVYRTLDKRADIDSSLFIERARDLHDILHKYRIPFVEISGGTIKSAVEIFSRVNSTGTPISVDFMVSALSYNDASGFSLSNRITAFLTSLEVYNFSKLKRDTILNCIANNIDENKTYFNIDLEKISQEENHIEKLTEEVFPLIARAIEFLYKDLFVLDFKLLPYPSQLIFICQYFKINPNPNQEQYELLKKWFWFTTYANYFTNYSINQQRYAYYEFCDFARGNHEDGIYRIEPDREFYTAKYPDKVNYRGVRPKALQLFYLKSLIQGKVQESESYKEFSIVSKFGKDPGNIIIRLSSDFELNESKKAIDVFIKESSPELLKDYHFITQKALDLYVNGKVDEFLEERKMYFKEYERRFVESMGIKYTV